MKSSVGKHELAARAQREKRFEKKVRAPLAVQEAEAKVAERLAGERSIELEVLLDRIARLEKVLLSDAVVERLAQYRRFLVPVEDWHAWVDYPKVSQWVPLHQVATALARARKERTRLLQKKSND